MEKSAEELFLCWLWISCPWTAFMHSKMLNSRQAFYLFFMIVMRDGLGLTLQKHMWLTNAQNGLEHRSSSRKSGAWTSNKALTMQSKHHCLLQSQLVSNACKSCLNTCCRTCSVFFFSLVFLRLSSFFLTFSLIHHLHLVIWRKINRIFGSSPKLWCWASCGSTTAAAATTPVICRHFTAAGVAILVKLWGYWLQNESSFTESSRAGPEAGWESRVLPLY